MKRKILFLDIDGVVNCKTTMQRHRGLIGIDPLLAFRIGKIVLYTNCLVVLSSSWRHASAETIAEVEKQVTKLSGFTPSLGRPAGTGIEYCERGREIKTWLDAHPDISHETQYAILDDENDMLPEQQSNFFQTSWDSGISEETMQKVIDHLNYEN